MKVTVSQFMFIGLFALFFNSHAVGQLVAEKKQNFNIGVNGGYQFQSVFCEDGDRVDGWLHLEGNPLTFRKSKLVRGPRGSDGQSIFLCYPKGKGYHIQMRLDGEPEDAAALEIQNTLKKEGARVFLVDKIHSDDGNYIIHPQRFLIQKAPRGYFIRSTDGRYLRCDLQSKDVYLTSEMPSVWTFQGSDKSFMWNIYWPLN